jgi:MoxR-like ATPase
VTDSIIDRLRRDVTDPLKSRFVGREEVVDLIALAVVSAEHLFLLGPPGTAKSALIRHFTDAIHGRCFEYMLTRFSEPNEIFGPIDIVKLREGTVTTVIAGMLPEADLVFLDEMFNANSAILNNLLTVLNERVYRRGAETHALPLLSLFSASNHLPDDEALQALFDRFLLRCQIDNLKREAMPRLLDSGWALETYAPGPASVSVEDLRALGSRLYQVNLAGIKDAYIDLVFKIRDLGIGFTDRRAVKVLKLIAASALLCGRMSAIHSDLWVLRYVWDRVENIDGLGQLVNGTLEQQPATTDAHPLAAVPTEPDAEELARQLHRLETELDQATMTTASIVRLRENVAELSDQAAWVRDQNSRQHLLSRAQQLLGRLT